MLAVAHTWCVRAAVNLCGGLDYQAPAYLGDKMEIEYSRLVSWAKLIIIIGMVLLIAGLMILTTQAKESDCLPPGEQEQVEWSIHCPGLPG